jgi:hypothetical protein
MASATASPDLGRNLALQAAGGFAAKFKDLP